ncbi:MAG: hypothetical protein HYW89_02685 [Candidatus Sungiibacteriota bacterium]|uniref:Uncharacterized protein n=1 Tax=Candidatus Sungiibacteriota bacterium TaxID=2750080 RepID=A0A7T5UQ77_9BACT|nr:MAG: hypothetical protein HYW89_02685 [Candidatus Sungbacteria bacterium]
MKRIRTLILLFVFVLPLLAACATFRVVSESETPHPRAIAEWSVPGAALSVGRGFASTPGVRGTTQGFEFSGGKVRDVYRR